MSMSRWTSLEKILVTALSATLIGAVGQGLLMWRSDAIQQIAINNLQKAVSENSEALSQGRQYTSEDANSDRQVRATHEAAVLGALTAIQRGQAAQGVILQEIRSRMASVEQEQRDAREERRDIEKRVNGSP